MTPHELTPLASIQVPVLNLKNRLQGFDEVELGYSQKEAVEEAGRCLKCGPCSECMACVQACKPGALIHDQAERVLHLNVDTLIYADDPDNAFQYREKTEGHIIEIAPDDPVQGSAAAAWVKTRPITETIVHGSRDMVPEAQPEKRIGVYICRCGDDMGGAIQTETLQKRIQGHDPVVLFRYCTFCLPEGCIDKDKARYFSSPAEPSRPGGLLMLFFGTSLFQLHLSAGSL